MGRNSLLRLVLGKFSITLGCIRKIPLNPPLQKGEEVGMPGLIEKLLCLLFNKDGLRKHTTVV